MLRVYWKGDQRPDHHGAPPSLRAGRPPGAELLPEGWRLTVAYLIVLAAGGRTPATPLVSILWGLGAMLLGGIWLAVFRQPQSEAGSERPSGGGSYYVAWAFVVFGAVSLVGGAIAALR